jgi:hypothetical protein
MRLSTQRRFFTMPVKSRGRRPRPRKYSYASDPLHKPQSGSCVTCFESRLAIYRDCSQNDTRVVILVRDWVVQLLITYRRPRRMSRIMRRYDDIPKSEGFSTKVKVFLFGTVQQTKQSYLLQCREIGRAHQQRGCQPTYRYNPFRLLLIHRVQSIESTLSHSS